MRAALAVISLLAVGFAQDYPTNFDQGIAIYQLYTDAGKITRDAISCPQTLEVPSRDRIQTLSSSSFEPLTNSLTYFNRDYPKYDDRICSADGFGYGLYLYNFTASPTATALTTFNYPCSSPFDPNFLFPACTSSPNTTGAIFSNISISDSLNWAAVNGLWHCASTPTANSTALAFIPTSPSYTIQVLGSNGYTFAGARDVPVAITTDGPHTCLYVYTAAVDTAVCFPATATVETPTGAHVPISSLALGDLIKSSPSSYSPVIAFSHRDPTRRTASVTLTTHSASLSLSPSHLLPARSPASPAAPALTPAAKIIPGVHSLEVNGAWELVTAVQSAVQVGAFNPHTKEGTIVVDGVTASCYTTAVHHTIAKALMWPVALVWEWTGVSLVGAWLEKDVAAWVVPAVQRAQSLLGLAAV